MSSDEIPSTSTDEPDDAVKIPTHDEFLKVNKLIKIANLFPFGEALNLYQTYTDFNVVTNTIIERLVTEANGIYARELPGLKMTSTGDEGTNFENLVGANDSLLDRINRSIDTLSGDNDPSQEFISGVRAAPWSHEPVYATIKVGDEETTLYTFKNIPRPQLLFTVPVDNSIDSFFKPILTEKPNCIEPLDLKLLYGENGMAYGYEHPYKTELDAYKQSGWVDEPGSLDNLTFKPELDDVMFRIVDTTDQLDALLEHLDKQKEIAVDLEHHGFRSFQGITCLIQISTDEGGDFVIDALGLRDHLHKLNRSFTNPAILKVFHGADNDILWLQRDFGVYVVGLFDTHRAARELRLPWVSLKYLLEIHCKIIVDKVKFSLADWRLRPLPEPMVRYARTDTHYLLFIARKLRRQLLDSDPQRLKDVFEASRLVSCKVYAKPEVGDAAQQAQYVRSARTFTGAQLATLRALHQWRDAAAREEDESAGYILPGHMLLQLAERMPRDLQGVHSVCHPMPPYVARHVERLHSMIVTCRETSSQLPWWRLMPSEREHFATSLDVELHDAAMMPPPPPPPPRSSRSSRSSRQQPPPQRRSNPIGERKVQKARRGGPRPRKERKHMEDKMKEQEQQRAETVIIAPDALAGPSHAIADPLLAIAGPSHAIAEPSLAIAGPSNASAAPDALAGPSHAIASPSHASAAPDVLAGPSHAIAGPSHAIAGPSHVIAGPSHAGAAPDAGAGPSRAGAAPVALTSDQRKRKY